MTTPPIPDTHIKQLDVLPLVKYYLDELNLYSLFDKFIPNKNNADRLGRTISLWLQQRSSPQLQATCLWPEHHRR